MAKATKQELIEEIRRIENQIFRELDSETRFKISERKHELLERSKINVTKNGSVRYYLAKNASYEAVDDYLTQLINATYDILGYCL